MMKSSLHPLFRKGVWGGDFVGEYGCALLKTRTREGFKLLIIIIATFFLLPFLGFSIGFGLFAGITMRLMGRHGWLSCGLTAVGIAIGIRYVFGHWLSIP